MKKLPHIILVLAIALPIINALKSYASGIKESVEQAKETAAINENLLYVLIDNLENESKRITRIETDLIELQGGTIWRFDQVDQANAVSNFYDKGNTKVLSELKSNIDTLKSDLRQLKPLKEEAILLDWW